MKVGELMGHKVDQGIGIDLRKVKMTTKANVAQARGDRIELPLLGLTIGQEQSTGDTSSPEISMPKYKTRRN